MRQTSAILEYVRKSTFVKFGIVGASGVLVNNGILWLLTQNGMGDVAASMIATETAIISNFVGNSLWTWGDHSKEGWQKRFFYFQLISLFAGALTVLLFWILHNIAGLPLLVANTTAIFVTFLVNYFMNKKFTWARAKDERKERVSARASAASAKSVRKPLTPLVIVAAAVFLIFLSVLAQAKADEGNGNSGKGKDKDILDDIQQALVEAGAAAQNDAVVSESANDTTVIVPPAEEVIAANTTLTETNLTNGTGENSTAPDTTVIVPPDILNTTVPNTTSPNTTVNTPAVNTTVPNTTAPNTTNSTGNSTGNASGNSTGTGGGGVIMPPVAPPVVPNTTNATPNTTNQTVAPNVTSNSTGNATQNTTPATSGFSRVIPISTGAVGAMMEIDTAEFTAPYTTGNVTWSVDGAPAATLPAGTPFRWTPGVMYVLSNLESRMATVTGSSGGQTATYTVRVEGAFNPFWDNNNPDGPVGKLTIMSDNEYTFTTVSAILDNGLGTVPLTMEYAVGHETKWGMLFSNLPGGNTRVIGIIATTSAGQREQFAVGGNIAHYRPGGSSGGGGGGGGGGGNYEKSPNYVNLAKKEAEKAAAAAKSHPPEFVYAVFSRDVVQINQSVNLTLDAKDNEEVTKVTAIIEDEDGYRASYPMRMVNGAKGYGTWGAQITSLSEGRNTLVEVVISDNENNTVEAPVNGVSVYAAGDMVRETEELLLVYALLDKNVVEAGENISVRLDARDYMGIKSATAVLKSKDQEVTVTLERIAGDERYGTWEGSAVLESTDTTYTLTSVTLSNGNSSREVRVYGQKVYVNYVKPSEELSGPVQRRQDQNFRQLVKNPFTPLIIGLAGMGVAMLIVSSMTFMRAK